MHIEKIDLLRESIKEMINAYEKLPSEALITPVSPYEIVSVLLLLQSLIDALRE